MSQLKKEPIDDGNDDDIRSIEGSEWTLETASIGSTIGDENAEGNENNSMNALLEAKAELEKLKNDEEKLKEAEEKAKSTIRAIQEKVDESAKEMAIRNAKYQERKQELEIEKKLALKSVEEKYQKENAELESEKMEENANFAKELASLKEMLKEKINWNQVDLVMGKKLRNPIGNVWKTTNAKVKISQNGLGATRNDKVGVRGHYVFAEQPFCIPKDKFNSTILFYFEVTKMASSKSSTQGFCVGLSNGNISDDKSFCETSNSYAILSNSDFCWLPKKEKKTHNFEWPKCAIKPKWNDQTCKIYNN